jgi:uncharacterized protein YdgA (DUF945 family)
MPRYLILLAILLSLGGLAAPGVIGLQAERHYRGLLARLQQQEGLALVSQTYRRGWLQAEARSELLYRPAGSGAAPATRIELHSQIEHGPWTPRGGWLLALLATRVRVDATELSAPLLTRVGFSGRGNARLAPAGMRFDGGGPRLVGLEGAFGFDARGGATAGWLQIAALDWPGPGSLENLRLEWQLSQGVAGILRGELGLRLARLALPAGVVEQALELAGLALRVGFRPQRELMSLQMDAELKALDLGAVRYGPARARLYGENLAPPPLAGLRAAFSGGLDPRAVSQSAVRQGVGTLEILARELLRGNPVIGLEGLEVTTPSGSVEGSLRIQARGLRWPIDWPQALPGLHGVAELRLPAQLARAMVEARTRERLLAARARRAAAGEAEPALDPETFERQLAGVVDLQLKALLNQGLLEPQGERLEARLRLDKGMLRVNGKDLPLSLALR